jgi:hypothetical protein
MKIDYLNGDPEGCDAKQLEAWVYELQERLQSATYGDVTDAQLDRLRQVFQLRPAPTKILLRLSNGRVATREALGALSCVNNLDRNPKTVDVHISQLRAALKPFDISIRTVWSVGYIMDYIDCEKIKRILAEKSVDLIPSDVDIDKHKLPLYVVRHIHK